MSNESSRRLTIFQTPLVEEREDPIGSSAIKDICEQLARSKMEKNQLSRGLHDVHTRRNMYYRWLSRSRQMEILDWYRITVPLSFSRFSRQEVSLDPLPRHHAGEIDREIRSSGITRSPFTRDVSHSKKNQRSHVTSTRRYCLSERMIIAWPFCRASEKIAVAELPRIARDREEIEPGQISKKRHNAATHFITTHVRMLTRTTK